MISIRFLLKNDVKFSPRGIFLSLFAGKMNLICDAPVIFLLFAQPGVSYANVCIIQKQGKVNDPPFFSNSERCKGFS
ncbi:MAG: hypothetical protein BGO07_01300 [Alphaproteobacteria bacterium 40-19]|nr:MAG: hypothetical protein BGO07_01300 [Alphaproteobacteria bacterium 40-19]